VKLRTGAGDEEGKRKDKGRSLAGLAAGNGHMRRHHMEFSLNHVVVKFIAFTVAVIGGIELFLLVLIWPLFIPGREEFMVLWSFIGWIPGGLIGLFAARVFWRLFRRALFTFDASTKDRLLGLICLLIIGVVPVSLVTSGNVDLKWQEEVKMADGQILIVNRIAKGEQIGGHFGTTGGGGFKEKELTLDVVKLPDGWQPPPPWRTEWVPVLLDYQPEEHTWTIVATFFWCKGPKSPPSLYTEYQSKSGGPWVVVPLEERLIGRSTNLYTHIGGKMPDFITVEERDRQNGNAANIYRKIIGNGRSGC